MSVTAAILLAASDATIEGTALALLPWDGDDALIEWQIQSLRAAGCDVIEVVLGSEAERLIPLVARDDVEPIVHGAWRADAEAAVRVGAVATPRDTLTAIIVDLAQPRPPALLRALLDAHADAAAPVTRPAYNGTAGWPVIVDAEVLSEVRNSGAERGGLRAILDRHASETCYVEMGEIVLLSIEDAASARGLRDLTVGA
ncbi:MAG TPA: NTP transferase domain-containing protein [Dehalococcoidia bacterium]|nr:NTP transferase domain-containing protein [Dehalococcoidia bacterium]